SVLEGSRPDAVVAPALGGVLVAHEVARAFGCRSLFTERHDGVMTLRRGFSLEPDERVVVVEDAITTGKSTREVIDAVHVRGGGALPGAPGVVVVGAGRPAPGVHARAQVAPFAREKDVAPADLQRALNAILPRDVRVLEAAPAPAGFHARKSALSKLYRYELDTGRVQIPTRRRVAGHVPWRLDEAAVRSAAELFRGQHDFASLASAGSSVRTTVRTILRSEVLFEGATMIYEVEADGFLRRMVRSLVGGLVAAGRGALGVEELRCALLARDRRAWPPPTEAR